MRWSIWACAREPWISSRHMRMSKAMERLMASSAATGSAEKRPAHACCWLIWHPVAYEGVGVARARRGHVLWLCLLVVESADDKNKALWQIFEGAWLGNDGPKLKFCVIKTF